MQVIPGEVQCNKIMSTINQDDMGPELEDFLYDTIAKRTSTTGI
jgi:hypothetical protein